MTGVMRVMRVMRVLRVLRVHLCVRVRVRLFLRLLQGVIAEQGQDQRRRRWLSQWHLLFPSSPKDAECLPVTATIVSVVEFAIPVFIGCTWSCVLAAISVNQQRSLPPSLLHPGPPGCLVASLHHSLTHSS